MTAVHQYAWAGESLTGFDDLGAEWTVTTDDGWVGGAALRVDRQVKAQQDGEWASKPLRSGRTVTLSGNVFTPSHAVLEEVSLRHAARPLEGQIVGETEGRALAGDGFLLDSPQLTHRTPTWGVWQLSIALPDPLLYGPETFASTTLSSAAGGAGLTYPLTYPLDYGIPPGVTPGAILLPNAGTSTYWPRLRIDGPVPNPAVSMVETGDTIRYAGTVRAGQWLDIDCANRRVLLNGNLSVRNRITSTGRWLAVPTGGGSLTWTADAADPTARLSAWGHEGAWL